MTIVIVLALVGCNETQINTKSVAQAPEAPTPNETDEFGAPWRRQCRFAWAAASEEQKRAEGGEEAFMEKCIASHFVVKCRDGHVGYGSNLGRLCADQGGIADALKFPDG